MATNPWEDYAQPAASESGPWEDYGASRQKTEDYNPPQSQDDGFFSRVGDDISKRWQNIKDIDAPTYGQASLRGAGQVAAIGSDIIGQGLRSVYRTAMPEVAQEAIAGAGRKALEYAREPIEAVTGAYGDFARTNPNLSKDIEAVANIGGFIPMAKGTQLAGKAVGKEALNIASDVSSVIGRESEQQIHNAVRNNIEKAIRPKVGGKSNFPRTETYYERATEAVKNIIDNKENLELTTRSGDTIKGSLPRSLKQFSEAIDQTKKTIYNEYHSMAMAAKDAGAMFNAANIIKKLDGVESDLGHSKVVRDYASKLKDDITELNGQSPDVIEKRIKEYNSSLDGYYADRTTRAQAQIDASVAQALREELDNTITRSVGAGYQPLRNKLMTLKTIEKEVAHRVNIASRQNKKGLIDFTDIFTGGELVAGLMMMNPAIIAKATAQKGIKELYKHLNSPDYMTKTMFSGVDDIIKRQAQGFQSKSFQKLGEYYPDDPLGSIDLPPVRPGKPYIERPNMPSTEIKSGVMRGGPYGPPSSEWTPPPPRPRELPAGQGFSLSGDPYTPDVIDAMFTSKSRPIPKTPELDMPRRDSTLALPEGQGFVFRDKPPIAPEAPKAVTPEPPKPEFIGSGLRAARERMAAQAVAKEKNAENIVTRVQQLGGITAGKDYNSKILRQNPDAKRVLRNTGGNSPDEIAAQLKAEGWPIESGDELIELLKSGKGRTIFNPENLEKLQGRYINKAEREWIERNLADQ